MNSSTDILEQAEDTFQKIALGDDGSCLYGAMEEAGLISEKFMNNNNELSKAWKTVEDTCGKVDASARNVIQAFCNDIRRFIKETQVNESAATIAVNTANEKAQDVLSRLGLN